MPDGKPDGFTPFADAATVRSVGALAVENGPDRIAVHGTLDIARDAAGLADARLLKRTFAAIVAALEAMDLPDHAAAAAEPAPRSVKNPFA